MEQVVCVKCCMDRSASEITFDAEGICNFCHAAQKALAEIEADRLNLPGHISRIKTDGIGYKYDCLIGLSGGVDSSTALHYAVQLGLRPLAFSVDNGFNDPRADTNIMQMVEKLKVPFYRYTIDLKKFSELQAAFMKAGVPNIEIPSDHLILATSLELAKKYKIRWIISGGNVATESVMPPSWGYNARDLTHIRAIYRGITGKRLTGLPLCGLVRWNYYRWIRGIRTLYLLDYVGYDRANAIKLLEEKYGWQDYGAKHEESVFTKWHINFYLFEKFGYDKRKAHLSSLINAGQITRSEALEQLGENPVYPELGIEQKVMQYQKRSHDDFAKDEKLFNTIGSVVKFLRKYGIIEK